jgi:PAS domain S-box-containing protein
MTPVDLSQGQVLHAMGHAVILTRADGVIIAWNPGAEELYGWTADEAIGRHVGELMRSPDTDENTAIWDAVLAGETWSGDYLARCKGDATALVHATSAPVVDDNGAVVAIVSVSHDVSERRSSEEALRREQARLRLAFASARMGSWSWDLATGTITWDDAMEARYGLAPGTFGGTFAEFMSRVHEDDRDRVLEQIEQAREGQQELMFEHRAVWPDGSVHWLEARGQPLVGESGALARMVGVGIDIDERKQLEALILEASELRATANLARDLEEAERIAGLGSWRWEAATNVVTVSTEMARILDTPRAVTGVEFSDALRRAVHPEDVEQIEGAANAALRSGRRRFVMECRVIVAGDVRQMVHRGEMLHDEEGNLIAVRGTFQDITEQRRASEALLATRDSLVQEQRAVAVLHETLIRPQFPEIEGFEIAARYVAAENDSEVGGDWYDAFAVPDGCIVLTVGDVSGHGVSSARLMAKLRHATRAYACIYDDLPLLIERLDEFLIQFRDDIQIATLLVARLEPSSARLELISAGHPPPLLVSGHESSFVEVPPGPPLGTPHDDDVFRTIRMKLTPRDAVLFYTDGLVERRAEPLDNGLERLRTGASTALIESADQLCDVATAACLTGLKRSDDVCLLALRKTELSGVD